MSTEQAPSSAPAPHSIIDSAEAPSGRITEAPLAACPFCWTFPLPDDDEFGYPMNRERSLWEGICPGCRAGVSFPANSRAEYFALWNRRPASPHEEVAQDGRRLQPSSPAHPSAGDATPLPGASRKSDE